MIPAITSNTKLHKVVVSTGNILNMNRLACKSNEELLDSLKLTLQCHDNDSNKLELSDVEGKIMRATQELNQKLNENERPEISIGAKLFLDKSSTAGIKQAMNAMLKILNVQHVDNVVLSYYSKSDSDSMPSTSHDAAPKDFNVGNRIESARNEKAVSELKEMWATLEEFAANKQISQLGVADLDVDTLKKLHAAARVPPTIAQVSISSCCKVPPALSEFCSEQDIQLLTHADPGMLLTDEQFIIPGYRVDWTLRYQVHVRCRSVLTAKGYIVGASKDVA